MRTRREDKVRVELARMLRMVRRNARSAKKNGLEQRFKQELSNLETLQELADQLGWHPETPELRVGCYK